MRRALAFVSITRPPNGLLMFIAVLVGVIFSENQRITLEQALLAMVTAYGLNGSSMVINDYFDRDTDLISNPSRPIPAGLIAPREALIYSTILATAGLVAAALISIACLIFAALAYAAAFIYNARLKKSGFLGNMMVSVDVVAPFIYGAIVSDGLITPRVLAFAALAFIANTGREVIKGIVDVEGDAARNVATVARVKGERYAAYLGAGLYLLAVALSPIPYVLNYVSTYYLYAVALADVGFIYSALKIIRNPTRGNARRQKNLTLLWMLLALVSFVVGGLIRG